MSLNKKVNIVVPMAGRGSRFKEQGFLLPKPLIKVRGKAMIKWVVENLHFKNEDVKFIFITTKEHRKKYNLDTFLQSLSENCSILDVESTTEGAACTVLLAKHLINNSDNLLIANSDQFLEWNADEFLYQARYLNVDGMISTFENDNPKWSYAKEKNGFVCEVAEKKQISTKATTGVYYWKRGCDFVKYAEKMIENNIRTNNEFYVCPVFNEAIKDGKKIKSSDCDKMWGLGTPEDLDYFLKNFPK
jgi:NDP-sugar pyrophosphorylase family protein